MNAAFIAVLSLHLFILSNGLEFEVSLGNINDSQRIGWKFSKARPFHCFESTKDIEHSFLPVHTESLPMGHGLWVLRYKDFVNSPYRFTNTEDSTVSFIDHSAKAMFFDKISVRALIVGDLKFDLVSGSTNGKWKHKISLSNCTDSAPWDDLKWTTYEAHLEPMTHTQVRLQVSIHHDHSFIILDEIKVSYRTENGNKVESARVECKINPSGAHSYTDSSSEE